MARKLLLSVVFTTVVSLLAPVSQAQGQADNSSHASPIGILLVRPRDPVYPAIAHMANVQGEVKVIAHVRKDGTVDSVEYVSGPPLLEKAAMDSARESKFECDGCTEAMTSYPLTYTFQLTGDDCCNSPSTVEVSESQHHIWVTASRFCICDPAGVITEKVRSIKCLFLWKCARRQR